MISLDPAAAARIAAAFHALEQEIATAGVPPDVRAALIIQLAAGPWDERLRREQLARWEREGRPPLSARAMDDDGWAGRRRRRGRRSAR